MSKCSYEERLEWAYIEGQDYAEQVALDPIENLEYGVMLLTHSSFLHGVKSGMTLCKWE